MWQSRKKKLLIRVFGIPKAKVVLVKMVDSHRPTPPLPMTPPSPTSLAHGFELPNLMGLGGTTRPIFLTRLTYD